MTTTSTMSRLTNPASSVNTPDNKKVLSRDKFVNYVATQDTRARGGT